MKEKPLVIGTRGSDLALWQANAVRAALSEVTDRAITIMVIETRGDKQLNLSLSNHKLDKGLFTRELEEALHSGAVDFAVHSLKDMPVDQPDGLVLAGVLRRGEVRDVIVAKPHLELTSVRDLAGLKIGTGSPRRVCQLRSLLDPSEMIREDIRGNVPTRIQKVLQGDYDATLLAYVGLERLGLTDKISLILPLASMLPAPGQAAVGIQCCSANLVATSLAHQISDAATMQETQIERLLLSKLGGGCALPLGVYCRRESQQQGYSIEVAYAADQLSGCIRRKYFIPLGRESEVLDEVCHELANTPRQ